MNWYDYIIVILIAVSIQHVGQVRASCERWFHYETAVGKVKQTLLGLPHQEEQGEESQTKASERRAVGGLQGEAERVNEKGAQATAEKDERHVCYCPHCRQCED